ncbi:inositol oxygenase, partial [Tremellales sp. Uapishka_1]
MHAPEVSEALKQRAAQLDSISDAVDDVNILKGFDDQSTFDAAKDKAGFRQYDEACDRVKGFYAEQHAKQTLAYNLRIREQFSQSVRARMSVWEAMEMLNELVDESDPDTSVGQIEHLLQTAEAIRRDGKPEWMQLTGLVHDLGKLLCFFGAEGQWDVVGDTFVVGCRYSDKIIYADTCGFEAIRPSFAPVDGRRCTDPGYCVVAANPDSRDEKLQTENGIYEPGCGLDNVLLSWGHDEYLYNICKKQSTLPAEALSMIRYHSFYPWHRENAYQHLMDENDKVQLRAVRAFNPYDLYSKSDEPPSAEKLKPYYLGLIEKYFPAVVEW